ncbi:heme ABC transporter ATP-binding protein [Rudanella paleaurantiibacter]|uniref:Heme ABC transporter ATP-binding protein n=1 Tax=Rudanella paleaurantiibacter TaxID=2614655 RepID=A0A7J5TXA8_9BACT|nr:heme ABC transporter ATP-binding protein [Rudanella paleaurantiibacter]KAB7729278.1 heme ABC transporter ATP-binding protein [Rudanella paleaurantiibacter]
MLEANQITHQIGRRKLLDDVSLVAKPGELVAIAGANGAGKSTLLKTLSREINPTKGYVSLDNRSVFQFSAAHLARRRAVLAQQNPLAFPFSVYELVMMGRYPHFDGRPGADDLAVVDYVLDLTGITHMAQRAVPTLSGGEQQRVHLAKVLAQLMTADEIAQPRGLIQQPKYLLLDEPTTGLDLYYQHALLDIARAMTYRGYGVVAILHDLNLVMQYADRVLLLKDGRALVSGKPTNVLSPAAIRDAFGLSVDIICQSGMACPFIVPTQQLHAFSRTA